MRTGRRDPRNDLRGDATEQEQATATAWQRHDEEKRAASLTETEKEAEGDRLLAQEGCGRHHCTSRRTVSRRRATEIPFSQLEAPSYSGTRHLLRSMADALDVIDAQENGQLTEWVLEWEVTAAIRAERGLSVEEKQVLLGRLRGESLSQTARRIRRSHRRTRQLLALALAKFYAGKLRHLEAASHAAACFYESASRRTYRPPNCCGQSPLCLEQADTKLCAQCEHPRPDSVRDEDERPGDRNYCPLRRFGESPWGRS